MYICACHGESAEEREGEGVREGGRVGDTHGKRERVGSE